jgi:N-acetylneuraminic acid mutarotase
MDIDIRPCASAEEVGQATAPIGYYFGRSASNEDQMEHHCVQYLRGSGSDGTNPLNTLEAFTPLVGFHFRPAGVWTSPLAPMPVARTRLAVAAGPDGRIYALGGFDGSNPLTIVEAYNPHTNSWTTVAPMTTPRNGLAAATGPDGRIYAIGGFDTDYLSSVEAYDVGTNSWTHVASMVHPRYTLAAVTGPDKQIYAIGGEFRFASVNTVEVYNTATNRWQLR